MVWIYGHLPAGKFQTPVMFNCQKRKANNLSFSYDSLTIYDGGSSTSPMMGKYCGASIPPSHISSSKEIMVYFQTDSYNGYENGFKLTYNPTSNYRINLK